MKWRVEGYGPPKAVSQVRKKHATRIFRQTQKPAIWEVGTGDFGIPLGWEKGWRGPSPPSLSLVGYHTKPLRRETKLRSVYLNCVLGADPRFAGRGLGLQMRFV
jgi:hypothetical protein